MIKKISLMAITTWLVGCGTAMTLVDTDGFVSFGLKGSYCNTIPYIYSGVVYDFCVLNGKPDETKGGTDPVTGQPRMNYITNPLIFVDFIVSGAVDTIVSPYTGFRYLNGDYITVKN